MINHHQVSPIAKHCLIFPGIVALSLLTLILLSKVTSLTSEALVLTSSRGLPSDLIKE